MQQAALQNAKRVKAGYEFTLKELIVQGKAKKPQKPPFSVDSIGTLLSQEYYNLAGLFFSELDVPDSAYFYYREILDKYPNRPSMVPTLFALGTYYETVNEKEKADSCYQVIYDKYPDNKLYIEAAIKLGKVKRDEPKVELSNDPAERDYIAAENLYYEKKYHDAISGLTHVYLTYPKSSFVPKALYFIGMIYEDNLEKNDSAAVYYGILASKEYASTPYGKAVFAKYTEYKNEKERIEKEKEKKLKEEQKKEEALKQADNKMMRDSSSVNKENPAGEGLNRKIVGDEIIKPDSINNKEDRRKQLYDKSLNTEEDSTGIKNPSRPLNDKIKTDSIGVNKENPADETPVKKVIDVDKIKTDTLKNKEIQNKQLKAGYPKSEPKDSIGNKESLKLQDKKSTKDSITVDKENPVEERPVKKVIDDDPNNRILQKSNPLSKTIF